MNIFHIIKEFSGIVYNILLMLLGILCYTLCLVFVFPFCRKENTWGAGERWFAWHPVFVGTPFTFKLKNLRWLKFVNRHDNEEWVEYADREE